MNVRNFIRHVSAAILLCALTATASYGQSHNASDRAPQGEQTDRGPERDRPDNGRDNAWANGNPSGRHVRVPEPPITALMITSLVLMAVIGRRKRRGG